MGHSSSDHPMLLTLASLTCFKFGMQAGCAKKHKNFNTTSFKRMEDIIISMLTSGFTSVGMA